MQFTSSYYTGMVHNVRGIQCLCDQSTALGLPRPECFLNGDSCTSDIGCYLRRWYSQKYGLILQLWDCIFDEHDVDNQLYHKGIFCGDLNTLADVYSCCNTSDRCNERLQITLPIEIITPTPSTPSMYVSSSSLPLDKSQSQSHSSHSGMYQHVYTCTKYNSHLWYSWCARVQKYVYIL